MYIDLPHVHWRRNRGSGGSMNRDPELLGAPESGAKKFYERKEYTTAEKLKNWQVSSKKP